MSARTITRAALEKIQSKKPSFSIRTHSRGVHPTAAKAGWRMALEPLGVIAHTPMPRLWQATTITLFVWLTICQVWTAERREWVTLTNCQYVASDSNDGDSFHVRSGTNEFIVRLYFVDAPEPNLRYPERTLEQSEYFGVTLDETIKAGAKARDTVRELLREPFVVQTRWASAQSRSKKPRYYGFVEVGGKNLAELLVRQGLARTKGVTAALHTGEKSNVFADRLHALEAEARQKRLGIWASSTENKPETETK